MKVRAVFEFDVEGLPAYDDINDPACKQNIQDIFRRMLYSVQEDQLTELSKPAGSPNQREVLECYKQDRELVHRILIGLKVLEQIDE
jgi:hypothetical protein